MRVLSAIVSIALICISSTIAQASWVLNVGNTIKLSTSGPGTLAGEFKLSSAQPSSGSIENSSQYAVRFSTFCVQVNEFFHDNEVLTIRDISKFSQEGKGPLSDKTAALYHAFRKNTGNIFGQTYAGNDNDANLLQRAIWHFQGQQGYDSESNNKFVTAVNALDASQLANAGAGVWILNLTRVVNGDHQFPAQDQLYWDGTPQLSGPPVAVPEPTMVALFLFGAVGAGWTARRKSRNSMA